jgi:hypothetical protein
MSNALDYHVQLYSAFLTWCFPSLLYLTARLIDGHSILKESRKCQFVCHVGISNYSMLRDAGRYVVSHISPIEIQASS